MNKPVFSFSCEYVQNPIRLNLKAISLAIFNSDLQYIYTGIYKDIYAFDLIDGVRDDILHFIGKSPVQFWGYKSGHEYVALTSLFSTLRTKPSQFPDTSFDLYQEMVVSNQRELPKDYTDSSVPLVVSKAKWIMETYKSLMT